MSQSFDIYRTFYNIIGELLKLMTLPICNS